MGRTCQYCGEGEIISEPDRGALVCNSCGCEHCPPTNDFVDQATFTSDGRVDRTTTSFIRFGSDGSSASREQSIKASTQTFISLSSSCLDLSHSHSQEALSLALAATDGALAGPNTLFLRALTAASSYVVARSHSLPLSLSKAAATVPCEPPALAELILRLSSHLSLPPLPPFDTAAALTHALEAPSLSSVLDAERVDSVLHIGKFLLLCAAKWSLTTGRHPLPLVAAVATLSVSIDGVSPEISVDEVAKDIGAGISTSRQRLNELIDALVRAARALLPWGADVNTKNCVLHAPMLIRVMEMHAKSQSFDGAVNKSPLDPQCLLDGYDVADDDESKYFKVSDRADSGLLGWVDLSSESRRDAYADALLKARHLPNDVELRKRAGKRKRLQRRHLELETSFNFDNICPTEESSLIERADDVNLGFDTFPPSFVLGVEREKQRRERIAAARSRINSAKKPIPSSSTSPSNATGKKSRRTRKHSDFSVIDWEDCVIELLLLRGVKEEEIVGGHYNRLLDLYVFCPRC